jgi:cell division protein FtsL
VKLFPAILILIVVNLVSGLSFVYGEHQRRKLFSELQALTTHENDLELEWRLLQLEQSTLTAQSVIDYKARTRLGMFIPHPDEVIYIQP